MLRQRREQPPPLKKSMGVRLEKERDRNEREKKRDRETKTERKRECNRESKLSFKHQAADVPKAPPLLFFSL